MPGLTFEDGLRLDFSLIGNGREAYHRDLMEARIADLKPDIFFILLDTFMLYPWLTEKNLRPASTGFYYPSDGGYFPAGCEHILAHVDQPVAMAKYGRDQVKELFNMDAAYIPHAVDTSLYRPLSPEKKRKVRGEMVVKGVSGNLVQGFLVDKYVVGVVARNQGRKMLDRTLRAFKTFCKDKPDAVLYFHCDPIDAAAPFNMVNLVQRYGLENRVCWSKMAYYENYPLADMNKVYNSMDVFFLSTSGEGFGIPTIEAQACEVPVVVTDYTTTKELVSETGGGIAVPIQTVITGTWDVDRGVMDEALAVEALNKMYTDRGLARRMGEKGRAAVLKSYDWDEVINQWDELFERMMSQRG